MGQNPQLASHLKARTSAALHCTCNTSQWDHPSAQPGNTLGPRRRTRTLAGATATAVEGWATVAAATAAAGRRGDGEIAREQARSSKVSSKLGPSSVADTTARKVLYLRLYGTLRYQTSSNYTRLALVYISVVRCLGVSYSTSVKVVCRNNFPLSWFFVTICPFRRQVRSYSAET